MRIFLVSVTLFLALPVFAETSSPAQQKTNDQSNAPTTQVKESDLRHLDKIRYGYCIYDSKVYTIGSIVSIGDSKLSCNIIYDRTGALAGYRWEEYKSYKQ